MKNSKRSNPLRSTVQSYRHFTENRAYDMVYTKTSSNGTFDLRFCPQISLLMKGMCSKNFSSKERFFPEILKIQEWLTFRTRCSNILIFGTTVSQEGNVLLS